MNNNIIVSFVIPTFNSEKYIEECILSILNQSIDNFEIIIVDGISTDDTLKNTREVSQIYFNFN